MLFRSRLPEIETKKTKTLPEFAEDYYKVSSLVLLGMVSLLAFLLVLILITLVSLVHVDGATDSYIEELSKLEIRLTEQSENTSEGLDANSQPDMRTYILEQERKIRELEPLIGRSLSILNALSAIEKAIPQNILLNRLEFSAASNELMVYVLTSETNGVEKMVAELESSAVFTSVAIVKKERLRSQELYYEVEMQI